mgnify:FL=1
MNYKEELQKIYTKEIPEYSTEFLNNEFILYGAGSLGSMAVDLLEKRGLRPEYIVDKSAKGNIKGIKIISPEEIPDIDKKEKLFIICIATLPYNSIIEFLSSIGVKNTIQFYTYAYLQFPDLLLNGWTSYNITENEKNELESVCESLKHDECSLCHYLQFLWWKLRGIEHIYEGYPVLSGKKFFGSPAIPQLSDNEILLDAGCHYGQTIKSFIEKTNNKYDKIYAFEPDAANLEKCKDKFYDERIIYSDKAIYNECEKVKFMTGLGFASKIDNKDGNKEVDAITIDSLNINPTIIKLHTESDELKGLEGAEHTIGRSHPILMIMADHTPDSLYKIPQFITKLNGYKLYFNLHDYCGNTAVYYGVPNK